MSDSHGAEPAAENKKPNFQQYLTREPVLFALLSTVAVIGFIAVTALSGIYHRQQRSLGTRWFTRGITDLHARRFGRAVDEFRTALLYSRDNYSYRLNLAEALVGQNRTAEASAYLVNLWDREPENGLVNLELARIAARKGESGQALRYYNNAIYATWPGDQEGARQQARLELIHYLLKVDDKTQAQSELIALAANLGDDPARRANTADLFVQAGDFTHALAMYRLSLKTARANPAALAGAGQAAFELRRYGEAQQYLQAAVARGGKQSADLLTVTDLVLQMDPFRRHISAAQRDQIVIQAFSAAGARLQSCAPAKPPPLPAQQNVSAQQNLSESWTKMKPQITERRLRRDRDLADSAMELVFNIERQNSRTCAAPTDMDRALVLIARLHEGS